MPSSPVRRENAEAFVEYVRADDEELAATLPARARRARRVAGAGLGASPLRRGTLVRIFRRSIMSAIQDGRAEDRSDGETDQHEQADAD
jgi:hypothetical protein